jgi:hypothetical protein
MAHRLSAPDGELYRQHSLDIPDDIARRRIYYELDQLILQALVDQGLRMLMAPIILQRVNDWVTVKGEREALHNVGQLTKALTQIARLAQGKSKSPLDSWVRYKDSMLRETKVLKTILKKKLAGTHRLPGNHVLLDLMQEAVQEAPETFPTFARIAVPFNFVQANPRMLQLLIKADKCTPAKFVYELIGWSTNRTPEGARQVISRLSRVSH